MNRPDVAASHREAPRRERGAVLIQVAVAILGLTAFSVLVLDYGVMWVARSQAQNAADSAALAAAVSLAYYDAEDSALGPPATIPRAKAAGAAAGRANSVWGLEPDIRTDDVYIVDCPAGAPAPADLCVRVDVFRNQGRDPLPVFFAPLLGIPNQGVRAMAVAQVLTAQRSDCVKPWAIPDKWLDRRLKNGNENPDGWDWTSTYDKYSETGSTRGETLPQPPLLDDYVAARDGFRSPEDDGTKVTLKFGNPHQTLNAGWFFPIDLPRPEGTITGGDKYRSNIISCNGVPVGPGTIIQTEPGNMTGPTVQGVEELVAGDPSYWLDPDGDGPDRGAPACPTSDPNRANCYTKRIIAVPLFDVDFFMVRKDFCKNRDNELDPLCLQQCPTPPCGNESVNGRFDLRITKLLGFFIEDVRPNNDVTGYFVNYPGLFQTGEGPAPPSEFLRIVALVR